MSTIFVKFNYVFHFLFIYFSKVRAKGRFKSSIFSYNILFTQFLFFLNYVVILIQYRQITQVQFLKIAINMLPLSQTLYNIIHANILQRIFNLLSTFKSYNILH